MQVFSSCLCFHRPKGVQALQCLVANACQSWKSILEAMQTYFMRRASVQDQGRCRLQAVFPWPHKHSA